MNQNQLFYVTTYNFPSTKFCESLLNKMKRKKLINQWCDLKMLDW